MTVKAIMTFSDAPLERISNAQELTYATQGNPFIGGKNLCLNLKNLFDQYQGNPLIMLEDDIEVCTDFSTKVEDVINQKPDSVINFFFPIATNYKGLHKAIGKSYCFNQCVYFPSWFLDAYLDNYDKLIKDCSNDYKRNNSARILGYLLGAYNRDFYAYFPYLVKAKEFRSTLKHDNTPAQNRDFIDDYQG